MKRSYCLVAVAVLLALGVIGVAVRTRSPEPPRAQSDIGQAPEPAAPDQSPAPIEIVLKRGETLETALRRAGVERAEAAAIVAALPSSVHRRRLAPGEQLTVVPGPEGRPAEVVYVRSPAERYEIRPGDDRWTVTAVRVDVDTRVVALAGEVRDSLFASVERLGRAARLTPRLVTPFEWGFQFPADSLAGSPVSL